MTLFDMYEEISAITKPLCLSGEGCGTRARFTYHCCERKYCDIAARFALEGHGIELHPTGHSEIPFMGLNGCTIPLHLRPTCTIHACAYNYASVANLNDPYWQLRQRILDAESAAGRKI